MWIFLNTYRTVDWHEQWLLFLLEESDPKVVFLAAKILTRLLITHGPTYVKKFIDKSGGFVILKQTLKVWWNVPPMWIVCFALLFGHDVATIDFDGEFNHFNLADLFGHKQVTVAYPEAFSIITAMLEHGLRSIVQERGRQESKADPESPSPALRSQSNGDPKKLSETGKTKSSSLGIPQSQYCRCAFSLTNFSLWFCFRTTDDQWRRSTTDYCPLPHWLAP